MLVRLKEDKTITVQGLLHDDGRSNVVEVNRACKAGESIVVADSLGRQLIAKGAAEAWQPATTYETKEVVPRRRRRRADAEDGDTTGED